MSWPSGDKVLALCGGIGGAKLALGLSQVLRPEQLTIVVNTGDDFEHLGLLVCPDLDTVTYTLAGLNNTETGWGRQDETWHCLETLGQFGAPTWFQLGDRDLAIHLARRAMLDQGKTLSEVTAEITCRLAIKHEVVPMSDEPVRTMVDTDQGELEFQDYFVRQRCEPEVRGIRFEGADRAAWSPGFRRAIGDSGLKMILILPSNPFISMDPILALPGLREELKNHAASVIAVTPIVAGKALKGPTDKIMSELGMDLSALGVCHHYGDLLDGFVIDEADRDLLSRFPDSDRSHCCNTVMKSLADRVALARECLQFAIRLEEAR